MLVSDDVPGPPPRLGLSGQAKAKEKISMSTNVPALKIIPALGAQIEGMRHLTTRTPLHSYFKR